MIKLEKTLIEVAEQSLEEMKLFSDQPKSNDFSTSLHELNAYVYLAQMEDSTLSDEAIERLLEIEKQSIEIMKNLMQIAQQNNG